jgi:predicted enzyme related to lactoylglutathione lyase
VVVVACGGVVVDVRSGVPVGIELRTSDEHIVRTFYRPLLGWDVERGAEHAPLTCRLDGNGVATVRVDGTEPGAWRMVLTDGGGSRLSERVDGAGGTTHRVAPHLVDIVDPLGAICTVDERAGRAPLDHGWARASWFEIMTTDAGTTDRFYRSVFDYGINWPEEASEAAPFAVLAVDGQPLRQRPGVHRRTGERPRVVVADQFAKRLVIVESGFAQ